MSEENAVNSSKGDIGSYSDPRPVRSCRKWSLSLTVSPIAARLSAMFLSFRMYSIFVKGGFLDCLKCQAELHDSCSGRSTENMLQGNPGIMSEMCWD